MKKDRGLFDVAMGALDGAEVCEVVGNFLLHKLSQKYERKNLLLYCADWLAIFRNVSGPTSEIIKKYFCKLLRENDPELQFNSIEKLWISEMSLWIWKTHHIVYS